VYGVRRAPRTFLIHDFIVDIATGRLDNVASISARLVEATVEVTR
jgi:hypothetical protein